MGVLDSFRLDDKVVVVTGASSGLGVAFAQAFAEAGADVVLGARRVDRLAETAALVEAAGRKPLPVATDVSVPEQCQALIDSAMQTFGRVDILINNAGVGSAHPATRETPEQFRSVIDVNLNGAYWVAQASGRVMQPGSSIINIASVLGITTADLPQAAYSASKAAIIGLTRDLAAAVGLAKGNPSQRAGAGILSDRDDRRVQARLPGEPGASAGAGPVGRPARTRRHRGLAGISGRRLCHRADDRRRRRPDDHLGFIGL